MIPRHGSALLLATLGLAWGGDVAAQVCTGAGTGVSIAPVAGLVHYEFGDGTDGLELGAELRWRGSDTEAVLHPYRVSVDGALTAPLGIRGGVSIRVLELLGVTTCANLMGGAARFAWEDDSGQTVAGGAGLTLATTLSLGAAALTPYLGARGLAAATTGEILGLELDGSGGSVGLEGGATVTAGRLDFRASVAFDGFAGGLGATPYPGRAARLAVSWRF